MLSGRLVGRVAGPAVAAALPVCLGRCALGLPVLTVLCAFQGGTSPCLQSRCRDRLTDAVTKDLSNFVLPAGFCSLLF